MNVRTSLRLLMLMGLLGAGSACERASVNGLVVDERGDPLPGVAITVAASRDQGLTNAVGEYKVQFRPRGAHTIEYHKSGFAPAVLELSVDGPRSVQARAVEMWRVPPNAGVFLLRDYRFEATSPVAVTAVTIQDQGSTHGTQRDPETATTEPAPIIVLYRLPASDVRLARLEKLPVTMPDGTVIENGPRAWVLAEPIAVDALPMDQPERLLHRLTYEGPLAAGVYAVHWGALPHGHTPTDERIFMFRILSTEEAATPETVAEEPAAEGAPAKEEATDEQPEEEEPEEESPADEESAGF